VFPDTMLCDCNHRESAGARNLMNQAQVFYCLRIPMRRFIQLSE